MSINPATPRDDRPLTERIAEEVRALKARHQVSQATLADVLHIEQSAVSKRLRGAVEFRANEIGLLADFFGVDPAELVGGQGKNPPPPFGGRGVTDLTNKRRTVNRCKLSSPSVVSLAQQGSLSRAA